MKLKKIIFVTLLIFVSCTQTKQKEISDKKSPSISVQDSIKLKNYATKISRQDLFSHERQQYLDSILQITPNHSSLWQQKSMPLFKSKKYEVGMKFLDKAVELNPEDYLNYRAFIKCIFTKNYSGAIIDFNKAKGLHGESYVMDHSYNFYLGISHLQLNEFEKANEYLKLNIKNELKRFSEDWVPVLDWFYLGVSEFELHNYNEAILNFDKALNQYPTFADIQYYKVKCLSRIGKIEEAKELLKIAQENILNDNSFNEGNSIYERYPYQIYKEQLKFFID